jgi:hypothetical protein
MHRHLLATVALLLAACTPMVVVPDAERERAHATLDGAQRYLKVAVTVHPLFGDTAKRLLLDAPAGEVDLLRGAQDERLAPPPAERVLPPGTPVRIEKIEFPTPLVIAGRVIMSPRYHPWVLLKVPGEARPCVLVLSQSTATAADAQDQVDRFLTTDDPSAYLAALPADHRAAIQRKELTEGMSQREVELAWGQPEKIRIDRPARTEAWSWPGGKRRAAFSDDKLVRSER